MVNSAVGFAANRRIPQGFTACDSCRKSASMSTSPAIRITDLVKRYAPAGNAPAKLALDGVSFDVPQGQIFGLLGPNGAGKSTLINILAGLVMKTSGSAEIWGFDIDADSRNAKRAIGIVPQEVVFDPFFTPYEVLENQAGLYGVAKALRRSEALLREVHLADKRDAYARTLSGGMKRRLLIAKAMVHSPPVLVLDEPTAGVDVELRRLLWELVVELNKSGVTVVLTTHYLEEAEQLCDRIAIINHGKLIANKPTRELVGMAREKVVEVTVDRDLPDLPAHPVFLRTERGGERTVAITYNMDKTNAGEVLAAVQAQGLGIVDVTTREADLEDVFVSLTSTVA
jgi:ABC-2 type transport system ATP-binding protein